MIIKKSSLFVAFLPIFLFCSNTVKAQLFEQKDFYPDIKTKKGKYFNGVGGRGYWSIEKYDDKGRPVEYENYRKNELLSKGIYVYNSNDDKLYKIVTFSINKPNRIDTISRYEYKYYKDIIIYQKHHFSENDSTVIRLVENRGDTVLLYEEKNYYFYPWKNETAIFERRYTRKYKNDLLICAERFDLYDSTKETVFYEYYPNGKLKRRKIERQPEPKLEGHYAGGLGSNDVSYKYKFDKAGRVKTSYCIIEGKRYKIATYQYCGKQCKTRERPCLWNNIKTIWK